MNKINNKKGITLISLVVTIIILLILAGVTLLALSGENGILKRAGESKEETRRSKVEEALNMWKMEIEINKYSDEENRQKLEDLLDDLEFQKLITKEERDTIENEGEIEIGGSKLVFSNMLAIDLVECNNKTTNTITIKAIASGKSGLSYGLFTRTEGEEWNLSKTLENQNPKEEVILVAENLQEFTNYDWFVRVTLGDDSVDSRNKKG